MQENEKKERRRLSHLAILVCCTIFTVVLMGESYAMQWAVSTVWVLLFGVSVCWWIYLTKRISQEIGLWINVVLTMITLAFYGGHATSTYDLAPLVIFIMILYSMLDRKAIVNICMAVYLLTMAYDIVFLLGDTTAFDVLTVTRTLLHVFVVCMSGHVIKMDIKRKLREQEYEKEKVAELEEINRRMENFLANVSHELRTPINAVTGITTIMLRTEQDETKRGYISSVQMAGQRLFNQVEDILNFTEIDTGRVRVSEENYAISSLMNDIIRENQRTYDKNAPELVVNLDAAMPAMLSGDSRKVKKIIKHLVENGMKFTKEGGVYVKVHTIPKPYGVNLCVEVTDTGIGIPKEELARIRQSFYQADGDRNRKAGGLGLGLPIVYGMVAAMGGFIRLESAEGKGTKVTVSIPQGIADAQAQISVENRDMFRLGCFLEMEQYMTAEVCAFYNETIADLIRGLDLPLRRFSTIDDLKRMNEQEPLTHLFVAQVEYFRYEAVLRALDPKTEIIVISDEPLSLPADDRLRQIQKPFYSLSVASLLNAAASGERSEEGRMCCPGVRALVVDDEPMNLMVAENILNSYQMSVKTARSGMDAIQLCGNETFDLVFMDHMMPGMDGVETLKRLRKMWEREDQRPVVIAFTANAVSGARKMFLDEGFDEFIPKPIEEYELERVLKKVLPAAVITYVQTEPVQAPQETPEDTVQETPEAALPEQPEDEMNLLAQAGLHTEVGLGYCGGDEDFYREILKQFAAEAIGKKAELEQFLQKDDWDNYRIGVHALKGTAKMIGAELLSGLFKDAEDAAKRLDADYIRKEHAAIMERYSEAVAGICEALKGGEQ